MNSGATLGTKCLRASEKIVDMTLAKQLQTNKKLGGHQQSIPFHEGGRIKLSLEHIKDFSNIYLRVPFEHIIRIFCKLDKPSSPTHPKLFCSEAGLLVKLTALATFIDALQDCLQISRKGQFCHLFAVQ